MPRGEHEGGVERLADIAADVGHLGAVDAEPVAEVEVGHPGLPASGGAMAAAVSSDGGRPGPSDGEDGVA